MERARNNIMVEKWGVFGIGRVAGWPVANLGANLPRSKHLGGKALPARGKAGRADVRATRRPSPARRCRARRQKAPPRRAQRVRPRAGPRGGSATAARSAARGRWRPRGLAASAPRIDMVMAGPTLLGIVLTTPSVLETETPCLRPVGTQTNYDGGCSAKSGRIGPCAGQVCPKSGQNMARLGPNNLACPFP